MKQASGPEKINIEENSVGINFKKSEQVKKHLNNSSYPWKDEISSGPVINDSLVIYVDSKRLKDIIELESLKIARSEQAEELETDKPVTNNNVFLLK